RAVGDLAGGIKAMSSRHAIDTLQECREACGGQGFLAENQFGRLQADVDVFSTFEGDNTILNQMVAKAALDELKREARQRRVARMALQVGMGGVAHAWEKNFVRKRRTAEEHLRGERFHRDAFCYREEVAVMEAASKLQGLMKQGIGKDEAVNRCQGELLTAG